MGHVGGNDEHLPSADGDHAVVAQGESQSAFEDIGNLLVLVAVAWDDGALAQDDACQHGALTVDELAIDERVQVLERDVVKACVMQIAGIGQAGFSGR